MGDYGQRTEKKQTVIPCTIKQLTSAIVGEEANVFLIDGKPAHRMRIVAQIMALDRQEAAITLDLDDGTGRIDARYWLNADQDEEDIGNDETSSWQEGLYVRVTGQLRQGKNSDRNNFMALGVQPLLDFNEITFHFLEATLTHVQALKQAEYINTNTNHNQSYNQSYDQNTYAHTEPDAPMDDYQALYATVLDVVQRASSTPEGAGVDFIVEQMQPYGIDESLVRSAIEYLSSEGHIYPTFDEYHFKA